MRVVLRITEGPAPGGWISIASGDVAIIGRGPNSTLRVAQDNLISTSHFSVLCDEEAIVLEDQNSTNGTLVNGERVFRKQLRDGDRVQAGASVFEVSVDRDPSASLDPMPILGGGAHMAAAAPPHLTKTQEITPDDVERVQKEVSSKQPLIPKKDDELPESVLLARGFTGELASDILQQFQLDEIVEKLRPETGELPDSYAKRLGDQNPGDAITFFAFALPKRCAIWWATRCLRESGIPLTTLDEQILSAAEAWVKDPSETLRQKAYGLSQAQGHRTAFCWPAVAIWGSHGSMAPENCPVVPPPADLCGKSIAGAVTLAGVLHQPENLLEKQKRFIALATAISDGEERWK